MNIKETINKMFFLGASGVRLEHSSKIITKRGGRKENQDCCGYTTAGKENICCYVVADGLGGHRGGEKASKIAVETIINRFKVNPECSVEVLQGCIETANKEIISGQEEDPYLSSMRTTVVVLVSDGLNAVWGHVGDTRLYHFRKGGIVYQTEDHSIPQVLVDAGDIKPSEIRGHVDRNCLIHSLGSEGELKITVTEKPVRVKSGDAFLLCTDGFWEYVTEREMKDDLSVATSPKNWLSIMVKKITGRATGKYDNYSAIAVRLDKADKSSGLSII